MNKTSIEWTDYTSNLIRYRDPEGRSVHGVSKTTIGRIKRGTMWQPKGSALREWPS